MNNNLPIPVPRYNNKLKTLGKAPDAMKFINELQSMGIELNVHIKHQKPNEVQFTVRCRKSPKDVEMVTKLLFSMFGV